VAATALEALIAHAKGFSGGDDESYAETLALPFVHLWPDGEILRYDGAGDVDLLAHYARAGIDAETFGRSELDEARLVLDWPDLKAFHARFTRYTRDGRALGQSEAIWVAVRSGASWKLKLRIGAARVE
jgi:hypothetical protein